MAQFDQRNQWIGTQYNAGHDINVYQQPLSLTEAQYKRNRSRMLDRVKAIWIDGVLELSVQGAAQIALELQNKPGATVTPMWQVLREFEKIGQRSSADASIVQVFDDAGGEVLVLGEPGAGKTTLLLELTRELLQRAGQDQTHPIPVVFNLSSWATRTQSLTAWLASELHSKYQVSPRLATEWTEADQVLPLLDGLDEVDAPHRAACVEAINNYRREHGLLPTVVCSRQADYFSLPNRLLLRTAVVVQPLTEEQIKTFLMSGGESLEALRDALRKDTDLRALATTPLMLNVLTVAYQGTSQQKIAMTGTQDIKQEQIFSTYVQRILVRHSSTIPYKKEQIIHWLSSLAGQMKRQSQTIFYLEQLQPNWLENQSLRRAYEFLAVGLPGMLIGVLLSLSIYPLLYSLTFRDDLIYILVGGLLGGLFSESETARWSTGKKRAIWRSAWRGLIVAGIGLGYGLHIGQEYQMRNWLQPGIIYGLCLGLSASLLSLFFEFGNTARLQTKEKAGSSRGLWHRFIIVGQLSNGIVVGIIVGLAFGLANALLANLLYGERLSLSIGLLFGLIGILLSVILVGRNRTVVPAEIIAWSWRRAWRRLVDARHLRNGVLVGVFVAVFVGLATAPSLGQSGGLATGLSLGFNAGLYYWLLLGLYQGLTSNILEKKDRVVPNEGIRRSARNSICVGFISGLVSGLIGFLTIFLYLVLLTGLSAGLRSGLLYGLNSALTSGVSAGLLYGGNVGLIVGPSSGLLIGLLSGGLACLRHGVLRFLLWRTRSIPWNYVLFLDFAAERILLRKVGGGYIFLHRMLLDYFAAQETVLVLDEPTDEITSNSTSTTE